MSCETRTQFQKRHILPCSVCSYTEITSAVDNRRFTKFVIIFRSLLLYCFKPTCRRFTHKSFSELERRLPPYTRTYTIIYYILFIQDIGIYINALVRPRAGGHYSGKHIITVVIYVAFVDWIVRTR